MCVFFFWGGGGEEGGGVHTVVISLDVSMI